MITVYTSPNCAQCRLTTRLLDDLGHAYTVVSLGTQEQQKARERVAALGYTAAPVVVTADGAHWSGFRPDRLRALTIPA